ncbi:MAG: bacterial regulatory s, tetR family protein, partial [Akkermansiaceae bacterium]|nr:bacterial regulatory s, tetR family protein [Akkermansiaceae bacterium]
MSDEKAERVLAAALPVFMRYGYKRTTMGDIAESAGISRPALYLIFPSKEEIFSAGLAQVFAGKVVEIRAGLGSRGTLMEKLLFALEIWCVQPFEMILASPDARDLLESGYAFAAEVVQGAFAEFETVLVELLGPAVKAQSGVKLPAARIAHILTTAPVGFKQAAASADQLREMIAALVTMVLAGLGEAQASSELPKERRGI